MTDIKPYKSPFGFYFTAQEEAMYRRAIEEAARLFETYGKGAQPVTRFRPIEEQTPRPKLTYYEDGEGSLLVMERKAEVTRRKEEEIKQKAEKAERQTKKAKPKPNDWMCVIDIARMLNYSNIRIWEVIRQSKLKPKSSQKTKGRPMNLYSLSEVSEIMSQQYRRKSKVALSAEQYQSGRYMTCVRLLEAFGLNDGNKNRLAAILSAHKVPYWSYPEKEAHKALYDYDTLKNEDFIIRFIRKYKK